MNYEAFEAFLILKSRHPSTIQQHIVKLKVLDRNLRGWGVDDVGEFLVGLRKEGRSSATINHYIDTIRLYAQFQNLSEELKSFRHLKKEQSEKTVLEVVDIQKLLELTPPKGVNIDVWNKDTLFLKLLATCIFRPGELARVRKQDISGDHIRVKKTKTGQGYRLILIHDAIKQDFFNYVKNCTTDELFLTSRGNLYSDHSWMHMFEKRMKLTGLDKVYPQATLYSLRHSGICEYLRKRINAQTIAKMAGTSVDMVYNVYSHMVTEDVDEAIKEHPIVAQEIENNMSGMEILSGLKNLVISYISRHKNKLNAEISENSENLKLSVWTRF